MLVDLFRVGADAELRYTPAGDPVANVPLAYDIGFGERKRTGWVQVSIWGKRAEALAPKLEKGTALYCELTDVEVEQYTSREGKPGAKLKARLVDCKFAGGSTSSDPGTSTVGRNSSQGSQGKKPEPDGASPADFDDDEIPF